MDTFVRRSILGMFLYVAFTDFARSAPRARAEPVNAASATPLDFQRFFKMPVGPHGLEPSKRLLALVDRQVRVSGYVAKEQEPVPGRLLLAPVPMSIAGLDGPAGCAPGATLFVHLAPGNTGESLRKLAGPVKLIGRLEVGGRKEIDGRVSYVRLYVGILPLRSPLDSNRASGLRRVRLEGDRR